MRALRHSIQMLLAAAILAAPAALQAQVRDNTAAPRVGRAGISGVVVTDDAEAKPLRRSIVTLVGAGIPTSVITDDAGRFAITGLPAGTYTLLASRPAYVNASYGAKRIGGSGQPITLAEGQQVTGLTIRLLHGSVITGVIRLPSGLPSADTSVMLLKVSSQGGRRRTSVLLQESRTDSRGVYRAYGLAPGDYIVRAQPPPRFGQGDLRQTTAAEVAWARQAVASASAAGTPPPPPANGRPANYAPTFYPGTADLGAAAVVSVGVAEERGGADFTMVLAPVAAIGGTLVGPDGEAPKNGVVTIRPASVNVGAGLDQLIGMAMSGSSGTRVDATGRFAASGLAPGRYRIIARAAAPNTAGGLSLWAEEEVTLDGQDITGLSLQLQPGASLRGSVVFEGDDPAKPTDPSRVRAGLAEAVEVTSGIEYMMTLIGGGNAGGVVAKDGTFAIGGIAPGRYRAQFLPPGLTLPIPGITVGDGWVLRSVMHDGRDLADTPFDVRLGQDVSGVVTTFTRKISELSGRVLDANGNGVAGLPIVVFTTDRAQWTMGSRRIAQAKPGGDGRFSIKGLPAGEYYVCALTDLDMTELYDAAFLDQIVAGAFKITLGDGEKKAQDLKLGGGH
jgi:hypothetical protein